MTKTTSNSYIVWISITLFLTLSSFHGNGNANEQGTLSREQAIAIVKQQYPGKALKVSQQDDVYIVRVLTSTGKVKQIRVDKTTGKLR